MKKSELRNLIKEEINKILKEETNLVGNNLEVTLLKKYDKPGTDDDGAFEARYDIKLNGKKIGGFTYGSYFGDTSAGTLFNRPLPNFGSWEPVGMDTDKMLDDDEDLATPEYMKAKLVKFLNSKTGQKWLEQLKKSAPDAMSSMQ